MYFLLFIILAYILPAGDLFVEIIIIFFSYHSLVY